jgi:hypothetical protein
MRKELLDFLADAEFMIREEAKYLRTGKHNGIPMRDCLGQWESLARTAKKLFDHADEL